MTNQVPNISRLGAIILAGGKSRRMGTNKATLRLNGETFLERLVTVFASADLPIVVVGGDKSVAPVSKSKTVYANDQRTDAGPLEGMRVGLATLAPVCDLAFVVSCDCPLLRIEFVNLLADSLGSAQAAVPRANDEIYGTTAVYRTDIHPFIDQELRSGNHAVKRLLTKLTVAYVEAIDLKKVDPELISLINVNTPEDYERVRSSF